MTTQHTVEESIAHWKYFLGELYHDEPNYGVNCEVCGEDWDDSCTCPDGWTVDLYYFVCEDPDHVEELREIIMEAYENTRDAPLSGRPEFLIGSDIFTGLDFFLSANRGDPEEWEILKWMRGLSGGESVEEPRDTSIKKTDTAPCDIDW